MRLINNMVKGMLNLVMTLLVMATPLMAIIYASSPAVLQKNDRALFKIPVLFAAQPDVGSSTLTKQLALTTPLIDLLPLEADSVHEIKEPPAKHEQKTIVVPPAAR